MRKELGDKFLQHFGFWTEERYWSVRGASVLELSGFKEGQDDCVLPYCGKVGMSVGEAIQI